MTLCRVLQTLSEECFKNELPGEAEKFLKFAVDTNTDFLPIWQSLGEYYLDSGKKDSLRALHDKALSLPEERFDKIRDLIENLYNLCGLFE
jgi:tetratricopeptide (TPR) repeat protein